MLCLHRSERADHLVEALGDVLLEPLADPMATEVVAVPARGVERWLTQRLSHRLGATGPGLEDGVCANFAFPFPGALVGMATALGCGFDADTDPWPPERSVWPLLELVDAQLDEPFLAPLAAHLRATSPVGRGGEHVLRRFPTVRHLADLYDRYAVHRPDMVRDWAEGSGSSGPRQGPAWDWQPELWRRLRARIGVPSPAERFETASQRLALEPELLDLPDRVSLFGLTRLPVSHLRILRAISLSRDVHLYLLHPSGALWERMAESARATTAVQRRSEDATARLPTHPLLRSWGRDAREMQLVLGSEGVEGGDHRPVEDGRDTLLGRIQAGIRGDIRPPGRGRPAAADDPRPLLGADDDSLAVHSCHGRARQVEVVRDAVLHLLANDPTLEARDVIVMCPDIETFAPLIQAAFGAGQEPEAEASLPPLRIRLADRALRQTNPLLAVASHLLDLSGERLTATDVLDLSSREPVSRRFHLDEEDLARLGSWVAGSGIRWGLDGAGRRPWGLGSLEANTWSAGLDRLLLGVAMAEDEQRLFGDVLPVDDVSGGEVDLLGRLAELIGRLGAALGDLAGRRPIHEWVAALAGATEWLALAAPADAWQHEQLRQVLDEVAQEVGPGEGRVPSALDRAEVRSLLGHRLEGRPTRANFRTGDLTICTLVPMRSVPHRAVCLLGLDDGGFPRHTQQDGDDLLLADPYVGDRDARSEDRQLLLDAVLAATEHLIITYGGRDLRTNQERPPAVPVSELLDVVDRTVRLEDPERRPREAVLVRHPLQSFDARNFTEGGVCPDGRWSFDPVSLEGARALAGPRRAARPFLSAPLAPRDQFVLELDSLVRFVEHPVRAFLRERLALYANEGTDQLADSIPVELDALERWGVGDRVLSACLAGAAPDAALNAERARGSLPPGILGESVVAEVAPCVEALLDRLAAEPSARATPESFDVNLRLPDGRTLVGTVPGVRGATIVRCVYSRLGPKHRLAAWVRFLALGAGRPELEISALTLGRGRGTRGGVPRVGAARLGLFPGDAGARRAIALAALVDLVDLYDQGMREPLPLYCATSAAWAAAVRRGDDPAEYARREWESSFDGISGEDRDAGHVLIHGGEVAFRNLLAERAAAGEGCETGKIGPARTSRFAGLAHGLWDGLLDHEQLGEQ